MNKPSSSNKKAPPKRAAKKPTPVASSVKAKSSVQVVAPAVARTAKPPSPRKSKVTPAAIATTVPVNPGRDTKQSHLINLLNAPGGATIAQIREATGWQAHTVRGTISGVLRKKLGFQVTCLPSPESGTRLYRITGSAV